MSWKHILSMGTTQLYSHAPGKHQALSRSHLLGLCWMPKLWATVALQVNSTHLLLTLLAPKGWKHSQALSPVAPPALKISQGKAFPTYCYSDAARQSNLSWQHNTKRSVPSRTKRALACSSSCSELLKSGMAFEPPTGPPALPDTGYNCYC